MDKAKARSAFSKQCWDANKRGIQMLFTFEEWCQWWENQLGHDWQTQRGCRRGQYVMARHGDKGPYIAKNVYLATVSDNHIGYNVNRQIPKGKQRPKLWATTVTGIYLAEGNYAKIAKDYGVSEHQVHCIKTKKYYSSITDRI